MVLKVMMVLFYEKFPTSLCLFLPVQEKKGTGPPQSFQGPGPLKAIVVAPGQTRKKKQEQGGKPGSTSSSMAATASTAVKNSCNIPQMPVGGFSQVVGGW